MDDVIANVSNLLYARDQFCWIRGVEVALLLVALVHWGRALWTSFANRPKQQEKESKETKAVDKSNPFANANTKNYQESKIPSAIVVGKSPDCIDVSHAEDVQTSRPRDCCMCVAPRASVGDFGKALQAMIRSCREKRSRDRIRTFDDCTVKDSSSHLGPMRLTETRCTQFKRLREVANITEESYEHSMCGGELTGAEVEVGGKSGSFFMRTHDRRYVLKTIEEHEFVCLKDILPHMVLYLESHRQSLLCRFVGAYSLDIGATSVRFCVMANVLPYDAREVYDLKGTTEDRWVNPDTKGTLKDNNFNQFGHRMLFHDDLTQTLVQRVQDDAEFLGSLGVMDYSLLVGVTAVSDVPSLTSSEGQVVTVARGWLEKSGNKEEIVFQLGIIDFLQRWTPKKVAAHWLKKAVFGCIHEIDTEPPEVYYRRFWKYLVSKIQDVDSVRPSIADGSR